VCVFVVWVLSLFFCGGYVNCVCVTSVRAYVLFLCMVLCLCFVCLCGVLVSVCVFVCGL